MPKVLSHIFLYLAILLVSLAVLTAGFWLSNQGVWDFVILIVSGAAWIVFEYDVMNRGRLNIADEPIRVVGASSGSMGLWMLFDQELLSATDLLYIFDVDVLGFVVLLCLLPAIGWYWLHEEDIRAESGRRAFTSGSLAGLFTVALLNMIFMEDLPAKWAIILEPWILFAALASGLVVGVARWAVTTRFSAAS